MAMIPPVAPLTTIELIRRQQQYEQTKKMGREMSGFAVPIGEAKRQWALAKQKKLDDLKKPMPLEWKESTKLMAIEMAPDFYKPDENDVFFRKG